MLDHRFVTLFNRFYLTRGIALIESLLNQDPQFRFSILAMDEETERTVKSRFSDNLIHVFNLNQIMTKELEAARKNRSFREFCWTLASSFTWHIYERSTEEKLTYVDADCYFFHHPKMALPKENFNATRSPHWFSQRLLTKTEITRNGLYCVQFLTFSKNPQGRQILDEWRKNCLDWCYDLLEEGKFGDQKYLDEWDTRYEGVVDLRHRGAGTAPWNLEDFQLDPGPTLILKNESVPVIFHHFHKLRIDPDFRMDPGEGFFYPPSAIQYIYKPYLLHLKTISDQLIQMDPTLKFEEINLLEPSLAFRTHLWKNCKRWLKKQWHLYQLSPSWEITG